MDRISITTESGDSREERIKEILQDLLTKYDLSRYDFTDKVHIKRLVIPHSHPVLTLNTYTYNENSILSTYLHEQIHWFMSQNNQQVNEAIQDLRYQYPEVPVGGSEGARDEHSTYLHLVICPVEYKLLKNFIGDNAARKVIENSNVYQWIYKTTIEDYESLMKTINKYSLNLE